MIFKRFLELFKRIFAFTGTLSGRCFLPPLKREEERELVEKSSNGDRSARNTLIEHNMRLVAHMAKKYSGIYDVDDLISAGSIGLVKAIDSYSPGKGTTLATYTAKCIENEILMLLRANKKYKNDVSLSEPIGVDKEGNELNLQDILTDGSEDVISCVEKRLTANELTAYVKEVLTQREYEIICYRYGLDGKPVYTQREVAVILGISRSYISRIEKKSIAKLKKNIKGKDFYC